MKKSASIYFVYLAVMILAGLLTMPALAAPAAMPPQYFSTVQDIPLMPGLTELTEQTVVFDNPEGRIVESVAVTGVVPRDGIERFYEATLPQLGWVRTGPLAFAREGETLRLNFENFGGQSFLRLTLKPTGSAAN